MRQPGRSGRKGGTLENGFGGDKLLVKAAEDERLVLHKRSANCESAKFIVQSRLLGQVIACRIGDKTLPLAIVQRVEDRVVLTLINASVPGIAAGFRDDVNHRTGIAAILRAKIVGNKHVLLHEFHIADKQPGAAYAVVIVVLTVNLLVIVAAAQTVG